MSDSAWIASDTTCPPLVCLVKPLATGRLNHVPRSPPSLHVLLELLPAAMLMLGERTEHGRTCQHKTKRFHHMMHQHVSLIRWYAHIWGEFFVASEILLQPIHGRSSHHSQGFLYLPSSSSHSHHLFTWDLLGLVSSLCFLFGCSLQNFRIPIGIRRGPKSLHLGPGFFKPPNRYRSLGPFSWRVSNLYL